MIQTIEQWWHVVFCLIGLFALMLVPYLHAVIMGVEGIYPGGPSSKNLRPRKESTIIVESARWR